MPYHQTKKCMPWLLDFGFRVRHGRGRQCTLQKRFARVSCLLSGCILGALSKQANFGVCQFRKSFSPLVFFGVHCTLLKVHSRCIVSPWPQNAGRLQVPFLKNNTAQSALFCGGRHPSPKRPPTLVAKIPVQNGHQHPGEPGPRPNRPLPLHAAARLTDQVAHGHQSVLAPGGADALRAGTKVLRRTQCHDAGTTRTCSSASRFLPFSSYLACLSVVLSMWC